LTGLDWNAWRAAYPTSTYEQQQRFYSDVYRQHPEQRHFNKRAVRRAIEQVQPRTVVELGGWDGELAERMLERHPDIVEWINVEVCKEAAHISDTRHPRLSSPYLSDFYWTSHWHADLFVASHAIEHLTVQHLEKTIAATHARALYLDAPLEDAPESWEDYHGSHILDVGWDGVDVLCERYGYLLAWRQAHASGKACLYQR
jgi:hypothetical protein